MDINYMPPSIAATYYDNLKIDYNHDSYHMLEYLSAYLICLHG